MKWAKMEALTYHALLVEKHAIDYTDYTVLYYTDYIDYTVPSILFEFWKAVVDIIQMYIIYAVVHFKTHVIHFDSPCQYSAVYSLVYVYMRCSLPTHQYIGMYSTSPGSSKHSYPSRS